MMIPRYPAAAGSLGRTGRPLLAIGCAAWTLVLIATCPSSVPAQQPAGVTAEARPPAEKKAASGPAQAKAAEVAAARAEAITTATPIFRSLFAAELRFIRVASGASQEQARRMARAAQGPLRSMVADFAETQMNERAHKPGAGEFDFNGAYRSIRRELASIAKDQLSPEQWDRLQDQIDRRHEHRKRSVIRSLLVSLDELLVLSAGQLDQLERSLTSHWDPRWEAETVLSDHQPFPELPDKLIVPFLTEAQTAAWKKLEKRAVGSDGNTWAMVAVELAELTARNLPAGDDLDTDAAVGPTPKP
jgi:hypothetical protein